MINDDDREVTRIIARQGPRQLPFRVEPPVRDHAAAIPPVAAPEPRVPEPRVPGPQGPGPRIDARPEAPPEARPVVIVPPVGRPAVMLPPGGPARAGRSPLLPPPVVALPGAATPPPIHQAIQPPAMTPAVAVAEPPPPVVVAAEAQAPADPVVGWVVVLKGPGRGASLALHTGRNALGAAPDQDLRLAFGDPAIAATGHAFLVYDEEARAFFIEDGKKKDLVRLNGQLLTETRPLASGAEIRIGATTLRFVAFCGADFDWSTADVVAVAPSPAATPELSCAPASGPGDGI